MSENVLSYTQRGQGRPVVFIHGWLTSGAIWDEMLDVLEARGDLSFSAIAISLRGSSGSPGEASDQLDVHANEVWALLDAIGVSGIVDLVGHSMGGALVTRMATMRPDQVRRLIPVASVPPSGLPLPAEMFAQFDSIGGDAALLRGFMTGQVPEDKLDWIVDVCVQTDPVSASRTLRAWSGASFADAAESLPHDALVIAGASDPFLGPDVLQATFVDLLQNARLATVNSGHYPMLEATAELADLIAGELSRAT